ncbi:MAG: MFS transporter [Candidatus Limnocylindrales bacterium]
MDSGSAYRRVLRNRALVRLLFGEFVSSIGDWLYLVAIMVVVYQVTSDPVVLGIVGAARLLPFVVLSVPAGVVADRFDRRRILLVTDITRGALMVVLAALVAADAPVLGIIVVAILAACASAFFGPAIGAYLPIVVADERDLGPANSLWATLDNLAYFIGPAIAGLLIAAGGLGWAFLLNAASFAVVAVVLMTLPSGLARAPGTVADPGTAGDGEPEPTGVTRTELVRRMAGPIVVDAATNLTGIGLSILLVMLAIDQLHAGPEAVGYLEAATGVGGVVAGIIAGWFVARRLDVPLLGSAVIAGAGFLVLSLTVSLGLALLAVGIAVGAVIIMDIVVTTVVQRQIPDALRGRAMGLLQMTGVTSALLGSLLAPVLAGWWGLTPVLAGMGAALVLAAVVGVSILRRQAALGAPSALDAQPGLDPARVALLRQTILGGATSARLETAARRMVELPVVAGTVVIHQGDTADRFYVIDEGTFEVTQTADDGTERSLRELGPTDPFGEIGLLTGSARTASVTARSDARLFALEREDFLELVGSGPDLSSSLLALYRGGFARG